MIIALDMDNTIVDETGSLLRPGIVSFLDKLKLLGHSLLVFTNSPGARAIAILNEHHLRHYFDRVIAREKYDKENKGLFKNISLFGATILIDDDPDEIAFMKKIKCHGILISPFRKNRPCDPEELTAILGKIKTMKEL